MFSNVCNEIKKKCFYDNKNKQIQPLSEKLIEPTQVKPKLESKKVEVQKKTPNISNKLISCYEEDYTRNANEIMKLWQRN
jgi:hypothetical protein